MRRKPRRAEVDPQHPAGWATSDRNGHVGNLKNMKWQMEWRGSTVVNTRVLVHEDELDIPQRQLGTLVIPADPPPLFNARPENYSIDEEPISTRYTIGPDGYASLIRVIINNQPWYSNRIVFGEGANVPVGPTGTPGVPGLYSGVISTTAGSTPAAVHAAMPAGSGAFAVTGNAATLSAVTGVAAAAFLARTSGLDATHTNAYTALINGLVADGVWTKFDFLHVYATQDSTTALLNLVSTNFNGTSNGSPTFTADRGFTGTSGSSTVYIDTGFNPATASSPQFGNTAHVSCWALNNTTDTNEAMGLLNGLGSGSLIYPRFTDGSAYFRCNSQGVGGVATANSIGHYIANRSGSGGSSASEGYKNGSSVFSDGTGSVGVMNGNFYTIAGNLIGTGARGSAWQLSMASAGGSLSSSDASAFYTRLRTFMTAVGVP